MSLLQELGKRIWTQSEKKDNWAEHDTPHEVAKMIRQEADELVEAIEQDGEAFDVGSEIADVLYLALKLCEDLGFDPQQLVEMKMLRNDMKYPTDMNSNSGGYEVAAQKSKIMWKAMGGDKQFYRAYEALIAATTEDEPAVVQTLAIPTLELISSTTEASNKHSNGNGNGHTHEDPLQATVIYQAPV